MHKNLNGEIIKNVKKELKKVLRKKALKFYSYTIKKIKRTLKLKTYFAEVPTKVSFEKKLFLIKYILFVSYKTFKFIDLNT